MNTLQELIYAVRYLRRALERVSPHCPDPGWCTEDHATLVAIPRASGKPLVLDELLSNADALLNPRLPGLRP